MPAIDFAALLRAERARQRGNAAPKQPTTEKASHDAVRIRSQTMTTDTTDCAGDREVLTEKGATLRKNIVWSHAKVGEDVVKDVYYVSEFITEVEEKQLLQHTYRSQWVSLSSRRLQLWSDCSVAQSQSQARPMCPWLDAIISELMTCEAFRTPNDRPNHCLINEYQRGQGIMAHTDGPAFLPRVATLSLGSTALVSFTRALSTDELARGGVQRSPALSVVLEPRSLLVFGADAYTNMLHGIDRSDVTTIPRALCPATLPVGDDNGTTPTTAICVPDTISRHDDNGAHACPVRATASSDTATDAETQQDGHVDTHADASRIENATRDHGPVANLHLLRQKLLCGQVLHRDTRVSLTFRRSAAVNELNTTMGTE
eukprot:m.283713 g.283713  ORF g.283713 m.283713 type:complete len:373 (+) comp19882_c0_seq1:236-1354(+)